MSSQATRPELRQRRPSDPQPKAPAGTVYRGREGMWSWVLHRITGVGDLLLPARAHPRHRAGARLPEAYNGVIGTYKKPIMGLGELALVAAIGSTPSTGCASSSSTSGARARSTSGGMFWIVIVLWVIAHGRLRCPAS